MFLRFSHVILCLSKKSFFGSVFALCLLSLSGICDVYAQGPMPHVVDRVTAISLARAQGKLVLMIYGNEHCGNCITTENEIANDGEAFHLKSLVEDMFIYWYCDSYTSCRDEAQKYNQGEDSSRTLPMLLVIDPFARKEQSDACKGRPDTSTDKCILREFGGGYSTFLFSYFQRILVHYATPIITNLREGDEIDSTQLVVKGRMPWLRLIYSEMRYRLNSESSVLVPITDPASWSFALDPLKLKKGKNTLTLWPTDHPYSKATTLTFKYKG